MVKIGIIDSGIDLKNVQLDKISTFYLKRDIKGEIVLDTFNVHDYIGHGNDCFRIISHLVDDASFVIVKIFDSRLVTDLQTLNTAIVTCIENNVDIINISAGIVSETMPKSLQKVCDEAYARGIIIVAAQNNEGKQCYPSKYRTVISIGISSEIDQRPFILNENEDGVEFYIPQTLNSGDFSITSTSFACAKMTGIIANMLSRTGKLSIDELKTKIISEIL